MLLQAEAVGSKHLNCLELEVLDAFRHLCL